MNRLCTPKHILAAAEVRGGRLADVSALPPLEAAARIRTELQRIFLPQGEAERLMLHCVERMAAHAKSAYSSVPDFLGRIYASEQEKEEQVPCVDSDHLQLLTGAAGTGKSHVLAALDRVFCAYPSKMSLPDLAEVTIDPYHLVNARELSSFKEIMLSLGGLDHPALRSGVNLPKLVGRLRFRTGTCLICLDELQFLTQSQASALLAKVMLATAFLPPPSTVVGNFSLVRRLLTRPPEERQRYLGNVYVMIPDAAESAAWLNLLKEYQKVLDSILETRFLEEESARLWVFSAGWKRMLVELLVSSYLVARKDQRYKIRADDLATAYASLKFSPFRQDVEAFAQYTVTGRTIRGDLVCPLADEQIARNAEASRNFKNAEREALAAAARRSMLSAAGRKALDARGGDPYQAPRPEKPPRIKKSLDSLKAAGVRAMGGTVK